jgi:predicted SnoaL-like aldol condensation-catalyzing enzyme
MELEKAKALVREYFQRLLNQKDLSVCDEMLAPTYIDHDAPPDTPPGPEDTKAYVGKLLSDYPDMQVSVEDIMAEGNKVTVRNIWKGTHRESGKLFHQMGIAILQLNEVGQIVERWSAYKQLPSS